MKTSGAARISVQDTEDCGVWIDTVQMKAKAQKKRSARPISKLLNPFADGAGYNVAVALNFTQTKLEMPKTKQSSISKFFIGQRRVLNKMSTSVGPNEGAPEAPRESTSDCKKEPLESYVDCNQTNTQWRIDDECNFTSLPNIDTCDYEEESFMDVSQIINKDNLPSNNPGIGQESSYCNPEPSFTGSFVSQNGFKTFGGLFYDEENASTQKTLNGLPLQVDKENMAPISNMHVQVPPQTKLKSQTKLDQDSDSFKWIKPHNSPIKRAKCQVRDSEESLSTLFTQDSQGFRVIAHRGHQPLSPLKDQSDSISLSASCRREEDEDEEILFTQDSQGNLVMKH